MPEPDWLARKLLEDRKRAKQREAERKAGYQRREVSFDPFQITNWIPIAGPDPGYLPKTPMRQGKVGFWIACRACGKKFESKGIAYCEPCLAIPANERRTMKPNGIPCAAAGCNNIIAPTARADAKYCSKACREKARRDAKRHEINPADPDTVGRENVADKSNEINAEIVGKKPSDHFEKLRGDATLSDWKPHTALTTNIPDTPDFLRRKA